MVDGQPAAYLGVGLGVVMVVLDMTTAGIVMMLLGILAFAVLELSGADGRGQCMDPGWKFLGPAVLISIVIVGGTVLQNIDKELAASPPGQTVHLCGGLAGCTGIFPPEQWPILGAIAGVVLIAGLGARYAAQSLESNRGGTDR